MKKHIPLCLALCMTLLACQKEDLSTDTKKLNLHQTSVQKPSPYTHPTTPVGTTINYQLVENRIVLDNVADFDVFFWSILEKDYPQWIEETQFISLWNELNIVNEIDQYDIQKILNPEGIIEVKPWIFKLDFSKEKVYVTSSSNKDAEQLLVDSTPLDSAVLIFDFEDDVWAALDEVHSSTKGLRCPEDRAKNKYVSTTAQSCTCTLYNWQTTTIAVRYNRFGIWETVKAYYYNNLYDVYGQSNNHFVPAQINSGHFHYHFDERCGYTYYGTLYINPGAYAQKTFTLRSSKKPLERFKSVVNMNVNTAYMVTPPEAAQQLNCILDQF